MAGTITVPSSNFSGAVHSATFKVTSDGSGDVDGAVNLPIVGSIQGVHIVHDGTDTPTTGYNIYLKDQHGRDVLNGQGVSVASASDLNKGPDDVGDTPVAAESLTIEADGMGANKILDMTVFWR